MKRGKQFRAAEAKIDKEKRYSLEEALKLATEVGFAKFDESVDVCVNLGVDAKQSDQQVRAAVVLPHGVGKVTRVIAFAKGEKAQAAQAAGADVVGAEDLVQRIQEGWMDFDKAVATPDMMVAISKVAKILGPRGLMPNPKLGTVSADISKAVREQKAGKIEFRTEKAGIVQVLIGKRSFGPQKLKENFDVFMGTLLRLKPPTSKGVYLKKLSISTTMGPGINVDPADAAKGLI
ncbi:MAG: 50S ribosomal protein L1 [Proteobacteria bacterium]|nr:MAG: 50S ribosomal protein L1 [Pseudomonadota bacterium]